MTAPGATLGLALMYLKTNDRSIADSFTIPATQFELDFVRPDFIMLRVLARSLVMWDLVEPTEQWLYSQLPPLLQARGHTSRRLVLPAVRRVGAVCRQLAWGCPLGVLVAVDM